MSENGETYSAGKNFTLLPALTAWTNSISACHPLDALVTGMVKASGNGNCTCSNLLRRKIDKHYAWLPSSKTSTKLHISGKLFKNKILS